MESFEEQRLALAKFKAMEKKLPGIIRELQRMLREDKKYRYRRDPEFLVKFIRVKDYDVHRAYVSVKNYYKNIRRNKDIIQGMRPSHFLHVYQENVASIFKGTDRLGRSVGYVRAGDWDVTKCTLMDLQLAYVMLAEEKLATKETQLNGVSIICDCNGWTMAQFRHLTVADIKRFIITGQEGLPVRVGGLHCVNFPHIFWPLYRVFIKLVKKKIQERIHFHYDLESLHKYFDPAMLPKGLGGHLEHHEAIETESLERMLAKDAAKGFPEDGYYNYRSDPNDTTIDEDMATLTV